jgi:ubiquinone/menaquinone biosynthesis C-methylase UbiE
MAVGSQRASRQAGSRDGSQVQGPQHPTEQVTRGAPDGQRRRRVWAMGDYQPLVERLGLSRIGAGLVSRVGVSCGMAVLDVATGTGSTALAAASTGAHVWGLDVTRPLLLTARQQPRAGRLGVHWIQGDAAALPFPDGSFDCVLSTMGVMCVPDRARAAGELLRVSRPGGVIGLSNWTPRSVPSLVNTVLRSYVAEWNSPAADLQWGDEGYVRSLFAGAPVSLEFALASVRIEMDSATSYVALLADHAGPIVAARRALEAGGTWEEVSKRLAADLETRNRSPGDGWTSDQEYLETMLRKAKC